MSNTKIEKLIMKIESEVNVLNENYQKNLELTTKDWHEYCAPGSVNNWTHPELPPSHASFVSLCNLIKPTRILDFGSGLSSFCLRKHLNYKPKIVSIDNSFVWLTRVFDFCKSRNVNTENLFWLYSNNVLDLKSLPDYFLNEKEKRYANMPAVDYKGNQINIKSECCNEPNIVWTFTNTSKLDPPGTPLSLEHNSTRRHIILYKGTKGLSLNQKLFQTLDSLGKFNFVHFDYGGIKERESYLKTAFDMLDRSKESIIYVDDLHKNDIIYSDKKFIELVDEYLINEKEGIKLKCQPALEDVTGGYGAFYLIPRGKNENSNTPT